MVKAFGCPLSAIDYQFSLFIPLQHHHISIETSPHRNISTSQHLHIATSPHRHISTSQHLHIETSPHHHITKHNKTPLLNGSREEFCCG
ncbi:MAG: hypothetical protein IPN94_04275 [Sphingobacteriales bacterium]|nr:hypothetical protein [Sphingobacteriales bacterium]